MGLMPIKEVGSANFPEGGIPMAHLHIALDYVQRGQHAGGAVGYHRYVHREGRERGEQYHRYLVRAEGQGRDDLVWKGHDHLPQFAGDNPECFWQAADQYERRKGPEFYRLTVA